MSTDREVIVAERQEDELKVPSMWNVVFWNDDYTPMDFVVDMLVQQFGHPMDRAVAIMMAVHNEGKAVAGTYTHDIAETKMAIVMGTAQANEFPLKVSIEEAE